MALTKNWQSVDRVVETRMLWPDIFFTRLTDALQQQGIRCQYHRRFDAPALVVTYWIGEQQYDFEFKDHEMHQPAIDAFMAQVRLTK